MYCTVTRPHLLPFMVEKGKRFVTSSYAQPKVNNEFHLVCPLLIWQQGCSHYVTWSLQVCDNLAD